jgi:hypothetical protein
MNLRQQEIHTYIGKYDGQEADDGEYGGTPAFPVERVAGMQVGQPLDQFLVSPPPSH